MRSEPQGVCESSLHEATFWPFSPAARCREVDCESRARRSWRRAQLMRQATARRCTTGDAEASVAPLQAAAGARYALHAREPPSAGFTRKSAASDARRIAVRPSWIEPSRVGAAADGEGTCAPYERSFDSSLPCPGYAACLGLVNPPLVRVTRPTLTDSPDGGYSMWQRPTFLVPKWAKSRARGRGAWPRRRPRSTRRTPRAPR